MDSSNLLLTQEQRTAVEIFDSPLVMVAGAGSGKTRVLVERFLALVKRGVEPSRILTVTFTNEAAGELRNRILEGLIAKGASQEVLDQVQNSPWIGTIHGFCFSILQQYGSLAGLPKIDSITDDFEWVSLFSKRFEHWVSALPDRTLGGLLECFTMGDLLDMAETLFLKKFYIKNKPKDKILSRLLELLTPLADEMQGELRAKGSYTFNDLENHSATILSQFSTARERLENQFDAILVDEFQDTSRLQWEILRSVLGKDLKKLFIVGDPKQSIYGFRYADISLFREVSNWVEESGGFVQNLSVNYRSQETLLHTINEVSRELFENSTVPFQAMRAGKNEFTRGLEVIEYTANEDLNRSEVQNLETTVITDTVQKLVIEGHAPNSIALLFRNSDRIQEYAERLETLSIPTFTHITTDIFETYDLLDLLAYLEASEDPLNEFVLSQFLSSPYLKISVNEFAGLLDKKREQKGSLFDCLLLTPDPRYDWWIKLLQSGETRVSYLLGALFENTRRFPQFDAGVLKLLSPLLKSESLSDALDKLRVWKKRGVLVQRMLGDKDKGVRLMTVHASKGLEFSHVLLADSLRTPPHRQPSLLIVPGQTPEMKYRGKEGFEHTDGFERLWAQMKGNDEEEAKRILYVAMTRAKDSLTVFIPTGLKSLPKGSWAAVLKENLPKNTPEEKVPGEASPLSSDSYPEQTI